MEFKVPKSNGPHNELEGVIDKARTPEGKPVIMTEKGHEVLSPGYSPTSGKNPAYKKAETPGECGDFEPERRTVRLGIEGKF